MGLLSLFAKAGLAKKVMDEARKPANQQKAKDLMAKVRGRGDRTGRNDQAGQGDEDGASRR